MQCSGFWRRRQLHIESEHGTKNVADRRGRDVRHENVGEVAFLKAEGVPRREEENVEAHEALVSPTKPTPDRSEKLNGMEERDGEECEFWKNEAEEHEGQIEKKMREEEEEEETERKSGSPIGLP